MIKRLEWIHDVPEAMDSSQMELAICRQYKALVTMPRLTLEERIRTLENWLRWYHSTDFSGRYPTNQTIFVRRLLKMMKAKLISMGPKRHYIKIQSQ